MLIPRSVRVVAFSVSLAIVPVCGSFAQDKAGKLEKIGHIVVIYLENRSFDHLYGLFPNADGIRQAKPGALIQVDGQGRVFPVLPRVFNTAQHPPGPDSRFPEQLPNRPFAIDRFVPAGEKTGECTEGNVSQPPDRHRNPINR